ncbi:MAG: [acyl-carrier-protein] S-malonyltransferase [Verrucomicrobiales bacterium]|jgi:[acyl-carrier-protein] S-malonyltransferase
MIVFMYPGQGSQAPGMGAPWKDHPSWELVAEASEVADRDVADLLLNADAETLKLTRNSQLTTFVLSMVVLDAVTRVGVEAAGHAGHSLGEYSALTAAGVLDFADAVRLVSERGDAMQAAADEHDGTMAAILGLDDDQVDIACARVAGDVWVANYNAPGQVVIAGAPVAVEEASSVAKELGAKRAMALPVGGAFHTPFMSPARDRLRKALDRTEFRDADTFVVANVDGAVHSQAGDWNSLLNAQLCSPVRWRQTLHALDTAGATTLIEVGPGNVLTGLVKRTLKEATRITINSPDDVDGLLESIGSATATAPAPVHEGEHLFATERLVVSPAAGVFAPDPKIEVGAPITRGSVLGTVGDVDVRSAFAGEVQGFLALPGERVTARQPIAWLRQP